MEVKKQLVVWLAGWLSGLRGTELFICVPSDPESAGPVRFA